MYKKIIKKSGFTLVELVVVATILAILWAVGFSAYTWYITWARDTNRLVQLTSIYDGLNIHTTKWSLPIPDDSIDIEMNGNLVGYQWYAWENVLNTIGYKKWGKDPGDGTIVIFL
jgi:prepilin-type N-terminal cleavage/methylation domain-containing protein